MMQPDLETAGTSDYGPCECCGHMSRKVWGYLHRGAATEAAYFVHWTLGRVAEHGAHFDLVLGKWGDGATASDRFAVSLEFRRTPTGPSFMVIDSNERPVAKSGLATRALRRDDVVGTPVAQAVFALVDTIWTTDKRITELTEEAAEQGIGPDGRAHG
jgi:hypothetical protein